MNKPRGKLDFNPARTLTPAAIASMDFEPPPIQAQNLLTSGGKGKGLPSREGTQFVAAHIPIEAALQLKSMAVQRRTTIQALLTEAINDLFQKNGLNRIA